MTINVHRDGLLGSPNYAVGTEFDSNVRATEFLHSTVLLAVCGSAEAVDCPKTVKGSRSIGALKMRDLGTVKGPHLGCRSRRETVENSITAEENSRSIKRLGMLRTVIRSRTLSKVESRRGVRRPAQHSKARSYFESVGHSTNRGRSTEAVVFQTIDKRTMEAEL
ncbi:hypothetical protein T06_8613 [Trichinella sp. T6]|nr:hypothetical protein T06_8613 [Trichinella sp. T6]